jgi:hypothetical protein
MNIAAKALDRVAAIQPRPASLFEPSPGTGGALADAAPTAESSPGEPSADDAGARPSVRDRRPHERQTIWPDSSTGPHISVAAASPGDSEETAASRRQSPLLTPQMTEMELMAPQVPRTAGFVQPASASTTTSSTPPMVTPSPTIPQVQPSTSDQGADSVAQTASQTHTATGHEPVLGQHSPAWLDESRLITAHTPPPHIGHPGEPQPQLLPRGPVPVRIVAQPHLVPAVDPSMSTPAEAPPPAPIIRVSIGRIDVRAIMPPAPPAPRPKAARPSTGLSLEAYLKARQRGQR